MGVGIGDWFSTWGQWKTQKKLESKCDSHIVDSQYLTPSQYWKSHSCLRKTEIKKIEFQAVAKVHTFWPTPGFKKTAF